jgi:hypothetical protein
VVWLTSQSLWALVIGCLGIAALVVVGSRIAARALVPESEREGAHTIAAPLMPALGAAFAILAALTLADEAGYLSSAQQIVATEAGDASRLAWASTIPGVRGEPIRAALRRYLLATRTYEWHGASAANGNDPRTDQALADLERVVRAEAVHPGLGTPTSTELLVSVDALTSDRRSRLAAASRHLPGLYVITLAVAGIALIANASVLTLRSRNRVALLIGGLTLVIGLSMALVFALGTPWRGSITVSGSPIDAVVHDLANGYFRS